MTRWYFNKDRKPVGPLSVEEFRKLINAGELKGHQLVNKEGTTQWKKAVEYQELAALFSGSPVASPASTLGSEPQKIETRKPQEIHIPEVIDSNLLSAKPQHLEEHTKTEIADSRSDSAKYLEKSEALVKPDLSAFKESWIVLVKTHENGKNKFLQQGPFSTDQIKHKLSKKEFSYRDHIWKNGFEQWKVIAEVDLFASAELKVTEEVVKNFAKVVEKPVLEEVTPVDLTKTDRKVSIPLEQPTEITSTHNRIAIEASASILKPTEPRVAPVETAKPAVVKEEAPAEKKIHLEVNLADQIKVEEQKLTERRAKDRRELQRRQANKDVESEEDTADVVILKKTLFGIGVKGWAAAGFVIVGLFVTFAVFKSHPDKSNVETIENSSEIEEAKPVKPAVVEPPPEKVDAIIPKAAEPVAQLEPVEKAKPVSKGDVDPFPGEPDVRSLPTSFSVDVKSADIDSSRLTIIGPLFKGDQVNVKVVGKFGDIQEYPNYYFENKFSFSKNYVLSLNLSTLKLKSGFYTFSVSHKDKVIYQKKQFVGIYNSDFVEEMKNIKKLLSLNFQLEKRSLVKGMQKIEKHMKLFSRFSSKTKPTDKNWIAWKKAFLGLVPEEVRAVNSNFHTLAFPQEWKKFSNLIEKMKNYFALQNTGSKRMPSSKENTFRALNNEMFLLKKEINQLSIN